MSFKEAQGQWNPITKLRLAQTNLENGAGDYSQLITSKDNDEPKKDFIEHFAEKNPGTVSNIFVGFGALVAVMLLSGLLYWTYITNIELFIAAVGSIITFISIVFIVLVVTVKPQLKPDVFNFYIIIAVILLLLGVGLAGLFFWKYFGNRQPTQVPISEPSIVGTPIQQPQTI